ncbi:MAG: carbohydrate ABC transporter substrate-binding protein [Ruminococcus sp.]|nr:carbohydrate ABC transporter substrate-binding protein [Ruminococcus sp.]
MKRLIALLTAMTFFAGAVSCGKGKKSSSDTVVIPDGNFQDGSQEKIHIKLFYTTTFHRNDNDPINKFVRESGKYVLDETEFFCEDDPYGTQALTDMNLEILSGNSPDIIVTQPPNMEKLRKKGYLADLTPLMESYDGTKPDDFLPNVRESITHDGKIDYIYDSFHFQTATAKSSHFGKDMTNWSYKDAIETYKILPEGMQFLLGTSDDSLWIYMLTKVAYDSIDFEDSSCDFSGPFKETLEFLNSLPPTDFPDFYTDGELLSDRALLSSAQRIYGIDSALAGLFYDLEGSDLTFVGYPSINGSGAIGFTGELYGIMENSSHKEDAWAVINSILAPELQGDPGRVFGVPVISSALPEITSDKQKWKSGAIIGYSNPSHFDSNETWRISPEQIQQAIDYATSVKIENAISPEIDRIIKEEYTAVMNGEQSVDDCVDMLNNRIGTYLSENS